MLNNQPQAGRGREMHRLDFFRPDQIAFLVTHKTVVTEQLPNVNLSEWAAMLNAQISQNEELSNRPVRDFIAELCEQLNDDEHLPENQLKAWTDGLARELGTQGWVLVDPQPRSYSFPPVSSDEYENVPSEYQQEKFEDGFSIIVCNVRRRKPGEDTGAESSRNLPEINYEDENEPDDTEENETNGGRVRQKRRLLKLISLLDQEEARANLTSAGLQVEAVFPNWVASSGRSDSGGTGGPGGKPVPYTGTEKTKQIRYYFRDLVDHLKNEGEYSDPKRTDLYGDGTGVDVVILDTAPSGDDLVLAYKELVLRKPSGNEHPLVKSLLETDGLLKLYPATLEERRRMGNTSLNRHGYRMTDHGLFIAGIINGIVPKATIHLVEVLNQFGVGDIETIARGFAKAYGIYRSKKRHLVVNCSLCLDVPDPLEKFAYREGDEELIERAEKDFEAELRKLLHGEPDEPVGKPDTDHKRSPDDLRWVIGLRVICERLGKIGRQVVAAAGNQGENAGRSRVAPDARYPAAFSRVVGVGALPKNARRNDGSDKYDASSFSNLADKPENTGILALGGEPGEGEGVLGLYLGEFPSDESQADQTINELGWAQVVSNNKNGWAWWSGTSFATPILTGVIAAVLSAPGGPRITQDAVQALYTEGIIQDEKTDALEDVMPSSLTQTVPPP